MSFIRENILKIVVFIIILVVVILVFAVACSGKTSKADSTYPKMESKMVEATKKYLNKNPKLFPNGKEISKVNLDTLEGAGYISSYTAIEDSNVKCTGYTEIQLINEDYVYTPYIKCGNYYETKSLINYINDNEKIVTSGDGLYSIGDTLVYRGENPNNYVKVGDSLYRIIDIKDGIARIISVKRFIESTVWDDRYNTEKDNNYGINIFSKSRLKEFFNEIIKYSENEDENYFTDQEYEKMAELDICVGKRSSSLGDINSSNECQVVEPNQKVSLITVSDYARASLDQNCKTIFNKSCMNYNYFSDISYNLPTLTATSDNTYEVFFITDGVAELARAYRSFAPNIVIHLDKLSLYLDGDGTFEKPYTIR